MKNYRHINLQFFGGIGFKPMEDKPINDALSDDPTMKEILEATSAIALLAIKRRLANDPLKEVDRRIYYEAIDAKAKSDFGSWSVESAAEKEAEDTKKPAGFTVGNATVTVATDSAQFGSITDETQESKDVCFSKASPILDSDQKPSGWYRQVMSRVDVINDNLNLYPRTIYEPALSSLKQAGFPYTGENPHPKSYRSKKGKTQFHSVLENQCVVFRDAGITDEGYVWAEWKPMDTPKGKIIQAMLDEGKPIGFSNRMTGELIPATINGKQVKVARNLEIRVWDPVLNPAEEATFSIPEAITDSAVAEILDSISKEDGSMNFLNMTLAELKDWKSANAGHKDMGLCDKAIALKEAAEKNSEITNELEQLRKEKADREAQEAAARKKKEAQKALLDSVSSLQYDQKTKEALLKQGEAITDTAEVQSYLDRATAIIDATVVNNKLQNLGVPQSGRAQTLDPTVQVLNEGQPWKPIVDNIQAALDDQIRSMDRNFRPDEEMRKANLGILDRIMNKLDRENSEEYRTFMQALTDSTQAIENGAITDSAMSSAGDFAQLPTISLAFMRQVWQDLRFAQLVMAEAFAGTTYKIPVEFQSHDLYTQDDFVTGEYDGISTEGVSTFLLEFGGEWLKRGTVISKESQVELMKGPFNYDVVARNLANLSMRYQRVIDQKMSLEMIHTADEYQAKTVQNEAVAAAEMFNTGLPAGNNAIWGVKLLCGNPSGNLPATIPPTVRPRKKVWLDQYGRKQSSLVNDIVALKGTTTLVRGAWDPIKGMINPLPGQTNADYAVDFENSVVYFAASSGVDNNTNRPVVDYAYATNVSFFNLKVPTSLQDNPARYYNQLLERMDYERAYMGSAPRYVAPDFAIGSLNAMVNFKIAELFYKWASPEGTRFLKGDMWFGSRNGLQLGEMNAPWTAGDQRVLLGKTNATRFGVGSPLQMEGPEPYFDPNTMKITSAKQYYATQQISLATPLVIDENGITYSPPYRTIKFYNA